MAGQLDRSVLLGGRRGRLGDEGMGEKRGLHLGEFDAVPADLRLEIAASQELQCSVGQSAHTVTGVVPDPAVPVRPEHGRGLLGPPPVPTGDRPPAEQQFAHDTVRRFPARLVEDPDDDARQRTADHRAVVIRDPRAGRDDRALGGPVQVDRQGAWGPAQLLPQGPPDRLAAHQQQGGGAGAVQQPASDQSRHRRGRHFEHIEAGGGRVRLHPPRVGAFRFRQQVQFMPRRHPQERVPRGVEVERHAVRHPQRAVPRPLPGPGEEGVVQRRQEVGETPVFDHHRLGRAGRPRGVDGVRGVRRGGLAVEGRLPEVRRRPVRIQRFHDDDGVDIAQQGGGPHPGVVRGEGEVDGARLERRQPGDQRLRCARQPVRHDALRPGALAAEPAGQTVGAPIDFGEGHPSRAGHQRRTVPPRSDLGVPAGRQGRRRRLHRHDSPSGAAESGGPGPHRARCPGAVGAGEEEVAARHDPAAVRRARSRGGSWGALKTGLCPGVGQGHSAASLLGHRGARTCTSVVTAPCAAVVAHLTHSLKHCARTSPPAAAPAVPCARKILVNL